MVLGKVRGSGLIKSRELDKMGNPQVALELVSHRVEGS